MEIVLPYKFRFTRTSLEVGFEKRIIESTLNDSEIGGYVMLRIGVPV